VPRIVHFELPVSNAERAARFYGDVFGWDTQGWEGEEGYWLITTGTDEPGIDGAFIDKKLAPDLVNIIGVDSVDEFLMKAEQAGAEIVRGKMEIPNVGFSGYIRDPEGNTVGLFEPVNR
jgi:uncharacterized protein